MSQTVTDATRAPAAGQAPVAAEPRALLISNSLKNIARRSRTPRSVWVAGRESGRRWQHVFLWAVVAAFGVIVLVPNLVAGLYLGLIASDQFATETRFAVRGGEPSVLDSMGGMVGIPTTQRVQDSLIVSDYITSRTMVEAVDQSLDLRKMFSSEKIDSVSRFDPKSSNEELMYYWRRHVDVHIDSVSGIITVIVRAFTPEDSLAITNKIIAQSEALVNDLSGRSRRDALKYAQVELTRAKDNLQEKTSAMRDLRNNAGLLDTGKTSEVMTKMLGDLRLELIRMEQEYAAQRSTIQANSPQMRVLAARIDSMKAQITRLNDQMTGADGPGQQALSQNMTLFDREQLEVNIAQKQYVAAASAFERARIEWESQQVYLATFLKPVLAQEALFPRRFWLWSIVAAITLLLWGAGVGGAVLVRNHLAV